MDLQAAFLQALGRLSYRTQKRNYTIQDNGIGFSQDYAEKIFDMFQRLHNKNTYTGTGIGLALVKKVVSNHGGKLWAESVPGEGSAFKILLPSA